MTLMKMTLNLFTSSFILASNFECIATPITSQEIERGVSKSSPHSMNNSTVILHQVSVPLESSDIQLQENTFNEHTPVQFSRVGSCVKTLVDLAKREKYIVALSLLPLVQAEAPQPETIATNFYGTVLPTVIGASVLSAIIGPTIKDCIYRSYNKLMSSQFDKLHDFIDTTVILKWPHESLRWGYFAILRGNRDIGDIPIIQSTYASRWRSFYEWSTSQPYTVELRHAKQLLNFNAFVVRIVASIDQELTQDKSWARTELYQQPEGLFRGFYYQSGACNLHIRGRAYTEIFEGISPFMTSYMPISHASRHRVWKKFFAAYKNENIELLPLLVHKLFENLIVYEGMNEQDKVDIILHNNNNTMPFIYKRGFIIALQKTPFPSEVIAFPKNPILIEHNHEEIIQSQGDITSRSSSSSYSERDVRDKGKAKRKGRKKRIGSSSTEEESAV